MLVWIRGRLDKIGRRPDHLDGPYPYVHVNADGGARELHPDERAYLETRFQFGDGGRPYVKSSYSKRNGWGDLAGFLERSQLPSEIVVQDAPGESPYKPLPWSDQIQFLRDKGFVVTENPDGTFTATKPKPTV